MNKLKELKIFCESEIRALEDVIADYKEEQNAEKDPGKQFDYFLKLIIAKGRRDIMELTLSEINGLLKEEI